MNILFLCAYNRCRSPLADIIAREYLKYHNISNINIDSAGINKNLIEGGKPCSASIEISDQYNMDLSSFKIKKINTELLDKQDLIIIMDTSNETDLNIVTKSQYIDKTIKLGFIKTNTDIIDPYNNLSEIENVFNLIAENINELLNNIEKFNKEYIYQKFIHNNENKLAIYVQKIELSEKQIINILLENNEMVIYKLLDNEYLSKNHILTLTNHDNKSISNKAKLKLKEV